MKRSGSVLCLAFCLVAGIVLAYASAEQKNADKQQRGIAEVPYDFLTLDTKMPAGRYSVATLGPTHLFIRNEAEPSIATEVFTSPDPSAAVESKDAKLIFIEREGKNYLVGIINSDGRYRVTGLYGEKRRDGDIRKEIPLVYK